MVLGFEKQGIEWGGGLQIGDVDQHLLSCRRTEPRVRCMGSQLELCLFPSWGLRVGKGEHSS